MRKKGNNKQVEKRFHVFISGTKLERLIALFKGKHITYLEQKVNPGSSAQVKLSFSLTNERRIELEGGILKTADIKLMKSFA